MKLLKSRLIFTGGLLVLLFMVTLLGRLVS
jgi:hypothetical protein